MQKISSVSNQIIKNAVKLQQKKYREETKLFIAEGEKAIKGLIFSGFIIEKLFITDADINFNLSQEKIFLVNDDVMKKLTTTKTTGNCVAIVKQKTYNFNDFLKMKRLILLENIKDSGNLGTILRSCKAFETDGVLLLGDTVDIYNSKVVRASVGCFDLPIIQIDYNDIKKFKKFNIYSTALHDSSIPLKNIEFVEPVLLSFGSEAIGLSKKFLQNKTTNFTIETTNDVESLNLAVSVSICLYKIFSQKQ